MGRPFKDMGDCKRFPEVTGLVDVSHGPSGEPLCLDDVISLILTIANELSSIFENLCLLGQGGALVPYHSKDSLFHTNTKKH